VRPGKARSPLPIELGLLFCVGACEPAERLEAFPQNSGIQRVAMTVIFAPLEMRGVNCTLPQAATMEGQGIAHPGKAFLRDVDSFLFEALQPPFRGVIHAFEFLLLPRLCVGDAPQDTLGYLIILQEVKQATEAAVVHFISDRLKIRVIFLVIRADVEHSTAPVIKTGGDDPVIV
jgi:hypothetical protein